MSLAILQMADRAAAIALATAIGEAAGLPRGGHPRWRLRGGALARHLRAVAKREVGRQVCAHHSRRLATVERAR